MVSIESFAENDISWVDLAAADLDGAIEFYVGLFGWTTANDGETPYHMFLVDGRPVGGVMALAPEMGEMPPVWSTYVSVRDADAVIERARAAGGSVFQEPFDIPGGDRIAVIADPAGAALCLFEGDGDGIKVMDEVGAPCWFDCMSRDVATASAFYEAVFGWSSDTMDMGMPYTVFSNGDRQVCGLMAMPDDAPPEVPSFWQVNFVVADADAAAAYVTERGGSVMAGPFDTPFGRSVGIVDPWGAPLNLMDRSTATEV